MRLRAYVCFYVFLYISDSTPQAIRTPLLSMAYATCWAGVTLLLASKANPNRANKARIPDTRAASAGLAFSSGWGAGW